MEPVRLTPYVTHQLWTTNHNSNTIIYYQSYANQSVLTPNGGEVHKAYVRTPEYSASVFIADRNKNFDSSIDHSNCHQLDLTKLSKGV